MDCRHRQHYAVQADAMALPALIGAAKLDNLPHPGNPRPACTGRHTPTLPLIKAKALQPLPGSERTPKEKRFQCQKKTAHNGCVLPLYCLNLHLPVEPARCN